MGVSGPSKARIKGPDTVTIAREHGVTCLAVEAGATLLLDRDAVLTALNEANIALVGVSLDAS